MFLISTETSFNNQKKLNSFKSIAPEFRYEILAW